MANTYSHLYAMVVFAVMGRSHCLKAEFREELFKYITGIVKNKGQKLMAIGGVEDHIHILVGYQPDIALSDLVRDVKSSSTRFINDKNLVRGKFMWQRGFGAFSYSHSHIDTVVRYVLNQEEHHKVGSFKDEYLALLDKYEIKYDDKYLFEFD
ncbi:MAG: IS200/IS605 family transposase [Acidobacteriota bacterium]|nr:MAG: IS200/IS605 family transposase [Acidobacteriota bacterium]